MRAALLFALLAFAGAALWLVASGTPDEPASPSEEIARGVPPAPVPRRPEPEPSPAPDASADEAPAPADPFVDPEAEPPAPPVPAPARGFGNRAAVAPGSSREKRQRPARRLPEPAYSWREGARKRRAWRDPTLLAEWGGADRVRALVPEAEVVTSGSGFRLWRLPPSTDASTVLETVLAEDDPPEVHPVFHDGPTDAAPARALTGRVVVDFESATNEDGARAWAEGRGYALVRKLSHGQSLYVVAVGATGTQAFELVETLRALPEIADAHLDWWQAKVRHGGGAGPVPGTGPALRRGQRSR